MKKHLIIDAGNTNIKLALFQGEQLVFSKLILGLNLGEINEIVSQHVISASLLSSVRNKKDTIELLKLIPNCSNVTDLNIPLVIDYQTKHTLGADRIANAVAILSKTTGHRLAIDIGTCIKVDLVTKNDVYQGGSISPGIGLRYKAMNDYTGALPLLKDTSPISLLGKSTIECMHSGVINGIKGELNYFIQQYEAIYPDLTIFMTGGDAKYFDYSLKKNIFAVENLTLEGLFLILKANAK